MLKVVLASIILWTTFAHAEGGNTGVQVPMFLRCFDYDGSQELEKEFGELPFVEADGDIEFSNEKGHVPVKMRLFVNPHTRSWTLMYELGSTLHCVSAGGANSFRPAGTEPEGPGI